MNTATFQFHVPILTGTVDKQAGEIRGVKVITCGVEAKGHNLQVDGTTVQQIIECGKTRKKVQVKLDHKSGVSAMCGYLHNFRKVGEDGVADWRLLKTHAEFNTLMERAEEMPECFGLSAAFSGPEKGEKIGKISFARCSDLLAVDCVTNPAANPTGLFSEREVDTLERGNPKKMPDQPNEPTLADVMAAITAQSKSNADILARLDAIEQSREADEPMSPEEMEELLGDDNALLAQMEVDGIPADRLAEVKGNLQATYDAVYGEAAGGDTDADAAAAAGKGGDATAQATQAAQAATTALGRIEGLIHNFERKEKNAAAEAEDAEIEHAFAVVNDKITELSAQNESLGARNRALESQLRRNGVRAASPSAESTKLFSAREGDTVHSFEATVTRCFDAANKGGKPISRSQAIRLAIKENPEGHREWIARANGRGE